MKKFLIITLGLLVIVALLRSPFQATAQDPDNPESIYRAAYDAFNDGDVDGGMALIADDVVGVLLPPPPGVDSAQTGKEPFRQVMEDAVATNMQWELNDFHVNGETASYTVSLEADDFLADLGVYPLEFTGFVIVRDGLIVSEVWSMNEDSRTKLDEAMAVEANKMLVNRFYEELWYEGNLDVADELLSEDFVSHAFPQGGPEEIKAAVTGFRADLPDGYFIIDDMIVTENRAVVRGSASPARPAEGEDPIRLDSWILVLGLEDGKITDRWVAFVPQEDE